MGREAALGTRRDVMRLTFVGPLAAALLLSMLAVLAGCDYPDPEFQRFQRKFGWTEARVLASGWIPPRDLPADPAWCYHTLATPDCYVAPLPPGEHPRLIGFYELTGY